MMRAFVTGATGGLGGRLARRLQANGWPVTASGRDRAKGAALAETGIPFAALDLCDRDGLAVAMRGHDVVMHCAALSSNWGASAAFQAANVDGTAAVLESARVAGVRRVVFTSSSSVYFDFRSRRDIHESAPLPPPVNTYADSKRRAEELVLRAATEGVETVILRPRGIVGPGDQALAPRLARVAQRGFVPLPDGGEALVDVTAVDTAVDALIAAATAGPHVNGRIYNITNGAPMTVREVVACALNALGLSARLVRVRTRPALLAARAMEILARHTGGWEPPVTACSLGLLAYDQTLDITAARRDLAWTPRHSVHEAIAACGRWWRITHG